MPQWHTGNLCRCGGGWDRDKRSSAYSRTLTPPRAVNGPGRPLDISKPLAHAYLMGMEGVVVELWGDVRHPTQVRVQLDPRGDEDDAITLLLPPAILVLSPAA